MSSASRSTSRPKLVSVKSYNQIVNLLASETTRAISARKAPEFTLGTPTHYMRYLANRLRRAQKTVRSCEQQLRARGADLDHGRLRLHYQRRNTLQQQWRDRQQAALEQVQTLKLQALVDLTGASPAEAKKYLTALRGKLGKIGR